MTEVTAAISAGLTTFQDNALAILVLCIPVVAILTAVFVGVRIFMRLPKKAAK